MKTRERSAMLKGWVILASLALLTLPVFIRTASTAASAGQANSNRTTRRTRRGRKTGTQSNGNQTSAERAATPENRNATGQTSGQSSNSSAQEQRPAYRMGATRPDVKLEKSMASGDREVTSELPVPSGGEITYTIAFINGGSAPSHNLRIIDPVQVLTDFKLGSVTNNLGTTGLSVEVGYSKDGGETCDYTPVSGGGGAPEGFDRQVNAVCWNFTEDLSYIAPNNAGSVSYIGRRR